jgi:hypothetical protein
VSKKKLIKHKTRRLDSGNLVLAGVFRIIKGGEAVLSDFITRSLFVPLLRIVGQSSACAPVPSTVKRKDFCDRLKGKFNP